jgi:hypothetical protein
MEKTGGFADHEELEVLWEATDRLLLLIHLHKLCPEGILGLRKDLKARIDPLLEEHRESKKPKPKSFWDKLSGVFK